jgi:hypothetical protein
MNINSILKRVNDFYSLAAAEIEKLPENSKNLKTILKNIDDLETYNARKKYAERNLKHLSSGSSRVVYLTPGGTVVKLAKNDKGVAQNKAEANQKVKSKFLNKILNHSKKYNWLESTYLDKITEKQFKKMTGIEFDDFGESIRYALKDISGNKKREKPECFDEVSETKIFKDIVEIGEKNKLMPGDLARISSWLTDGEKPILGDAGLTKSIFEEFYES